MELIKNTPEKIVIKMEDNESLANAIRRSVDEISVLAVDEVEIYKNDSALYDEVLAHRIGLVPLRTEKKMGQKTELELKLSKKGPGWVYSEDLKGNVDVVYSKIPLTLLEKDQELELVATARMGKGIEHAKYVPGICYYRKLFKIKSKNPEVEEIIQKSRGLFAPEKKGDLWFCDIDESSIDEIEKIDKEAVKESEEIILIVESYGSMSAQEILLGAINALGENLDEFEKSIS